MPYKRPPCLPRNGKNLPPPPFFSTKPESTKLFFISNHALIKKSLFGMNLAFHDSPTLIHIAEKREAPLEK